MTTDEGVKVRCPGCGWFLAKVTSNPAQVEVNCPNWNCQTPVVIRREGETVTTTALPKVKQQQA